MRSSGAGCLVVLSYLMWVLGIELESSKREASAFKWCAVSAALPPPFLRAHSLSPGSFGVSHLLVSPKNAEESTPIPELWESLEVPIKGCKCIFQLENKTQRTSLGIKVHYQMS